MLKTMKGAQVLRRYLGSTCLSVGAVAALAATAWTPAQAQVTFATAQGRVEMPRTGRIEDITVEVTHIPSGSRRVVTTNDQGRFVATGLRIGGPYSFRFFGPGIETRTVNVPYIEAGTPFQLNVQLRAAAIEEVEVIGEYIGDLDYGSTFTFDAETIRKTPVIERRLQEIIRRESTAFVDFGQSLETQGISILGFNTRFNNLVVDGVSLQDSFGDSFTGFTTRRSAISLDAIESISVETAPFDVQNSGFQGGLVNITTKSGTNEFHGGAFFQRNGGDLLSADRAGTDEDGSPNLINAPDRENTWGVFLNGPIIKDKLFFLVSYEEFDQEDPLNSCPAGFGCPNPFFDITLDLYNQIAAASIAQYGFDPGSFDDIATFNDGERKFLAKLDWNINEDHRASLTWQRTTSTFINGTGVPGLDGPLTFQTGAADTPHLVSAQLFSSWTDKFSSQITFGFTRNERNTELFPGASGIGQITLNEVGINANADGPILDDDGNLEPDGDLSLAPDDEEQIERSDNNRIQFKARGEYYAGKHTLSFGYEFDYRDLFDIRVPGGNGIFNFEASGGNTTFENFAAGIVDEVSLFGAATGDPFDVAVDFQIAQHSFYIQDEWQVLPNLSLLFGLRYERFETSDEPEENPFFVQRYGFSNSVSLDNVDTFLPRFSFNWQPFERTTIRGGAGIFAGGIPFAYLAEPYRNLGINLFNVSLPGSALGEITTFAEVPPALIALLGDEENAVLADQSLETGVNSLDPNFENPRNLRLQFAVDQFFDVPVLGDNWKFTAEVIYSNILEAIQFQDLRLQETGAFITALQAERYTQISVDQGDIRPIAETTQSNDSFFPLTGADGPFLDPQDIQVTNTSEGFSTVLRFGLEKTWTHDLLGQLRFGANYSYTESVDVSPANDTDDLDDVFETGAYNDVNNPIAGPSIQAVPHNFVYTFDYRKNFDNDWAVTFSVLGNFRSGRATSLVGDEANNDLNSGNFANAAGETLAEQGVELIQPAFSDRAQSRLLAYLPTGPDDPLVRYAAGASFEDLASVIDLFGLQEFQGSFLPRNTIRADTTHQIDLNAQLEVPVAFGKVIFEGGIRNFLNLLDRDRGLIQRFSIRENLYDAGYDPATDQLVIYNSFNAEDLADEQFITSVASGWQAQLGVRFVF